MKQPAALSTLTLSLAAAFPAAAQTPSVTELDPVVVSAERTRQSSFDAPAAITAIGRDVIDSGGMQVNLSEALNRVPGISVLNRQNYAQDLQLSIRGFGSRSTFGIRGVRLIVDGIPATMPDGQGQASAIALGSAQRIEVLRGPLAQLYGNAAGGVVQVFSGTDASVPTVTAGLALGRWNQNREAIKFGHNGERDSVVIDAMRFATSGWREQAAAERTQFNAKWQRAIDADSSISLVANSYDQPLSKDPAGLTRADWQANPRQAAAIVKSQDASKVVGQQQIGAVYERRLGDATSLSTRLYAGDRSLYNKLSVPPTAPAQTSPTGSGGTVDFSRTFMGLGVQLAHEVRLADARLLRLTAGLEHDRSKEDRQGYVNNAGVQGALKRDELNTVRSTDVYAQAGVDLLASLTATAGVRRSAVKFESDDRFITAANPDDSGGVDYRATNPVLGLTWRASTELHLYANAGRGFETPTFTELSYRAGGLTGLNTELKASRSRHAEIGAKWKPAAGHRVDMALFDIATRDEIVTDTNLGGRTTFKNAGRTSRRGAEFMYTGQWAETLRATLSLTALRARFEDPFVSGSGAAAVTIPAGNRLPGTPERSAFAELAWTPKAAWGGFNAALEAVHVGKLYVNDANGDAAPAATVVNLRTGFAQSVGNWTFAQLLRLENAADKRYAGSVIVNDGNGRFFEPALPRNWIASFTAKYEFR
ncbi:TonB-dependent receptor family protein [Piscinibacter sp.]|uniref:TonB-dependent receptor family protein n=1 Tax=Piscinibacter sp. TaxID=1903157 RepID=UPI0039E24392